MLTFGALVAGESELLEHLGWVEELWVPLESGADNLLDFFDCESLFFVVFHE